MDQAGDIQRQHQGGFPVGAEERELIKKARNGDSDAFLELISRYDRKVMSVVYRFTADKYDREDLYQEIFLDCYRSIGRFQFRSSFLTWLYRIALNRCISFMRKRNRRVEIRESPSSQSPPDRTEKLRAIERAVSRLNGKQKICFHLHYIENWSIDRIAELLGCAEGTVKGHLHRARLRIRADQEILAWQTNT
jgi:RNA polymerase sigma-70 factor (ECF subfamily)